MAQSDLNARIGARVKARREYLGYKQDDLAELLNTTRANTSRKESGNVLFTPEELVKVARFLRCPITYFFDDELDYASDEPSVEAYFRGLPPDKQDMILEMVKAAHYQAKRAETTHGKKAE